MRPVSSWNIVIWEICIAVGALVAHDRALADGMFISRHTHDIWEPGQIALILYDENYQRQDLILQVQFYGDATDFAWIVPVPSLPDLQPASRRVFTDCADLTRPLRHRRRDIGCEQRDYLAAPADDGGVEILAEETVGIYQTLTLGADDAGALADSLRDWGYLHTENEIAVEDALRHYIDQSWFFVAMKVDTAFAWNPDHDGYWRGLIDPVHFSFESEEIVYPMRISAVSAHYQNDILIYVAAEHRMLFEGARTDYANRITSEELERIRNSYPDLGVVLTEPCFLTKLTRRYSYEEMTEDLVFSRAPNDNEFRRVYYSSVPVGLVGFLAVFGWTLTRAWRTRRGLRKI